MAKAKKVDLRIANPDDIAVQTREYAFAKKQVEYFEQKIKELRDKLFAKIEDSGEVDDKGNVILELSDDIEEFSLLTKQRRVSRKINEEVAMEMIEAKGLRDQLVKTIEVIDEDALMAALYNDELTEEEIDEMYPQTIIWALVMKKR